MATGAQIVILVLCTMAATTRGCAYFASSTWTTASTTTYSIATMAAKTNCQTAYATTAFTAMGTTLANMVWSGDASLIVSPTVTYIARRRCALLCSGTASGGAVSTYNTAATAAWTTYCNTNTAAVSPLAANTLITASPITEINGLVTGYGTGSTANTVTLTCTCLKGSTSATKVACMSFSEPWDHTEADFTTTCTT